MIYVNVFADGPTRRTYTMLRYYYYDAVDGIKTTAARPSQLGYETL